MKKPQKTIRRERTVVTVQHAINFVDVTTKELGTVASDYSSYDFAVDEDGDVYVEFKLDNPDYAKEIVVYNDWLKQNKLQEVRSDIQKQINAQRHAEDILREMLKSNSVDTKKLAELKRTIVYNNNTIQKLKEKESSLLEIESKPTDEIEEALELVGKYL